MSTHIVGQGLHLTHKHPLAQKYSFSQLYGKVGGRKRIPSLPSSNLPEFGLNLSLLPRKKSPTPISSPNYPLP